MYIYKILRKSEWNILNVQGSSFGSPIDIQDGFIHFSSKSQVAETACKHFAGETDLILAAVEGSSLAGLKWQPSRGGAMFPHLFRELRLSDIAWHREIVLKNGQHDLPELL